MSTGSIIDDAVKFTGMARGLQFLFLITIIIVGLIILVGGGGFVFTFINTLILEPIRGGRITAFAMIVLGVFVVILFNKFRYRGDEEINRSKSYEELKYNTQLRRRY